MKKMITKIAAVAAVMMMGAFAFAEGYICANDLEKGQITDTKQEEDGFVLLATADKAMEVKSCDTRTVGDDTFTQAISTKGSGNAEVRIVTFPAKAGEKITVFCNNSGSGVRPLHLINVTTGEEVKVLDATSYKEGDVYIDETVAPVDGTYGFYSTKGGVYIYQIKITK